MATSCATEIKIKMDQATHDKIKDLIMEDNDLDLNIKLQKLSTIDGLYIKDSIIGTYPILAFSTYCGSVKCVWLLLIVYNVDVNKDAGYDRHALYVACMRYGKCDKEDEKKKYSDIINSLIHHKSNCNLTYPYQRNETCLMLICARQSIHSLSIEKDRANIIRALLDHGADRFAKDDVGNTAFTLAGDNQCSIIFSCLTRYIPPGGTDLYPIKPVVQVSVQVPLPLPGSFRSVASVIPGVYFVKNDNTID